MKRKQNCKSLRKTKPTLIENTQEFQMAHASCTCQIPAFPVPVSRNTDTNLFFNWFEKQILYQFSCSLKAYLEVVRMGFSTFRPWWYLPLWCSSSSILSWECTEVSSGRPSARAAASKASWHSICFYKKEQSQSSKLCLKSRTLQLYTSYFCKSLQHQPLPLMS